MTDIDAIRERLSKATTGPWPASGEPRAQDVLFQVNAATDIATLLEALERAERVVANWETWSDNHVCENERPYE